MMRNLFRKHRWGKYATLVVFLTVACMGIFFGLFKMNAVGSGESEEEKTYVNLVGEPSSDTVVVTDEGSNQKGKQGSEATPVSSDVPTCIGKKGSETNPFVILEIVPDKSQQQLTYLGQDEDSNYPLDVMQLGIDAAKRNNKSYVAEFNRAVQPGDIKNTSGGGVGEWFYDYTYNVNKIGSEDETEDISFAEIAKLYELEISDEDIAALKDEDASVSEFEDIYKDNYDNKTNSKNMIKKLSEKFPKLFEKDNQGKAIRDIAIADTDNWKITKEVKTLKEEISENYPSSGYMIMVEPGQGEFGFSSEEDCKNWKFTKTNTDADRWIYVTEEEAAEKYSDYLDDYKRGYNHAQIWSDGFFDYREGHTQIGWSSLSTLYNMQKNEELTGLMLKLSGGPTCKNIIQKKETKNVYTFEYYGLKSNNILKRAFFTFSDEDEYENFHMKVICMTPAELNAQTKTDDDNTLDMVERADMLYIQTTVGEGTTVIDNDYLRKLYYKYVEPSEEKYNKVGTPEEKLITFNENDLEWSLCQKIIQRLSAKKTLPLLFNKKVGELLQYGVSRNKNTKETHMYGIDTNGGKCIASKGSLNNISKLYLISIQFNLSAKRGDKIEYEGDEFVYERTFMEDIYPNIKTVSFTPASDSVEGTAETTGYYSEMKTCVCDDTIMDDNGNVVTNEVKRKFKQRSYYLWNALTFNILDESDIFNSGSKIKGNKQLAEKMIAQGYNENYLGDSDSNPFIDAWESSKQAGSNGDDNKNVTVVTDENHANVNQSTFIWGTERGQGPSIANATFKVIYKILNNDSKTAQQVTVTVSKVMKMYTKISNDTIMIDGDNEDKNTQDKQLYIKVRIWNNENNLPGRVKSVQLVNDDDKAWEGSQFVNGTETSSKLKLYTEKDFATECKKWKDANGNEKAYQYEVSDSNPYLTAYIPITLKAWKAGYTTLKFQTVGYCYDSKSKTTEYFDTEEQKIPITISIIGRTLFDLE